MNSTEYTSKNAPTDQAWKELIQAIKPRDISILVNEGVVTLKGTADSYSKKLLAEQIVASVTGVKGIQNHIEVKLKNADGKKDVEITDNILNAFVQNFNAPQEEFSLQIENNWLVVEGVAKNNQGESVELSGKLCLLEEKNIRKSTSHHPAVVTNQDFAYWEIFG